MAIYKVSLAFTELPDPDLDAFTENVIAALTACPAYATPPVTTAALKIQLGFFTAALAAAAQGGKQATANKDATRETLLESLRQDAAYVQSVCHNDLPTLLSSGFDATHPNHAQSPLEAPAILKIINQASGRLALKVTTVKNARSYEVRYTVNGAAPQSGGISTQARSIEVPNLTPGTTYTFQVRAVGGSTGYSSWSLPVTQMAT